MSFIKKHIIHSYIVVILFEPGFSHELFIKKRERERERGKKTENLAGFHIDCGIYHRLSRNNSRNYTSQNRIALAYGWSEQLYHLIIWRDTAKKKKKPTHTIQSIRTPADSRLFVQTECGPRAFMNQTR